MNIIDLLAILRGKLRMKRGRTFLPEFDMEEGRLPASARDRLLGSAQGDLAKMTFGHSGRIVDKWTHYPEIYERHFSDYRSKSSLKMLEIGVFKGGSLEVWRQYFGPEATIFGIDINPECAGFVDAPNQVRIGSQADPAFLRQVVEEMGGVDIILDDGSHIARHQEVSFETLFPLLNDGGLYVIEDMHTSYWPGGYAGGFRRRGTAIELVKQMIDDMHGWYHKKTPKLVRPHDILAVHVYDSITFIEKGRKSSPEHIRLS